jgi:hypothetical protein
MTRSVDLTDTLSTVRGRTDDPGRGPNLRVPPSSAAASARPGSARLQIPKVEGAADLEAIAAGKHGAAARRPDPAEHPHAVAVVGAARTTASSSRDGAASLAELDSVPIETREQGSYRATLQAGDRVPLDRPGAVGSCAEPTGIRGRGESPGSRRPTPLDRAKERLAARNAHLAVSLGLHAERVEKRKSQTAHDPVGTSAAERLAAIRRRLHERIGRRDTQTPTGRATASGSVEAGTLAGPVTAPAEEELAREPGGRDHSAAIRPETGSAAGRRNELRHQIHSLHAARIHDAPACAAAGAGTVRGEQRNAVAAGAGDLSEGWGQPGSSSSDTANAASLAAWHGIELALSRPGQAGDVS